MMAILEAASPSRERSSDVASRIVDALGDPLDTGIRGLDRLTPLPESVAEAGPVGLAGLGVAPGSARAIAVLANGLACGTLRLDPGSDVKTACRALVDTCGLGERLAGTIVMRALHWPDAFPASDRALQRATETHGEDALRALAEQWRPWRAYAAFHLWTHDPAKRRDEVVRRNGQAAIA
jgi:AraC family transcriptional regulator of adaptative response / DNA-3-methyladenine glycosylase II